MQKQKSVKASTKLKSFGFSVLLVASMGFASFVQPLALADRFDEKIAELRAENAQTEGEIDELEGQADDLKTTIAKLQSRISVYQSKIAANQQKRAELKKEIAKAEKELNLQKDLLGQNIRAMYLEGDISTLEMLASSQDLSEFIDKQEYRNSIQDNIKVTLDKINKLKRQLKQQKVAVEDIIKQQITLKDKVAAQRAEQTRLLNFNQAQREDFNSKVKKNEKRIAELQRQQVIENAKLFGGNIPAGVPGGGGYSYGDATCLWPGWADPPCRNYDWGYPNAGVVNGLDRKLWDEWGYGYRNCTSWVAFKLNQAGKRGFSGLGHATNWPGNVPGSWLSWGGGASEGDAAVRQSGTYGHIMYVEAVDGDYVIVSDYNAGGDGYYRAGQRVHQSNLVFITFPDK